jgi:thiamine biosynthesis protein ThiS
METIRIQVNGKEHQTGAGVTVDKLLHELGLQGQRVAVAINHQCIFRQDYGATVVAQRDAVEILAPMAGG